MTFRLQALRASLLFLSAFCAALLIGSLFFISAAPVAAAGTAITSVTATYDNATGTGGDYSVTRYVNSGLGDANDPYNSPTGTYNIQHQLSGGNLRIQSFNIMTTTYQPAEAPDRIVLRRVNNAFVSGDHQLVWYERGPGDPDPVTAGVRRVKPTAITGPMDNLPFGNVINKGVDNLFANSLSNSTNNIERVDIIFTPGLTPILENLTTHGFLIMDRGMNDPFRIAAITGLDGSNNPASFGALQNVPASAWGPSGIIGMRAVVFRREPAMTELRPIVNVTNDIGGVFVSMGELGISAGQTFYGYSLFADDVDSGTDDLLDPSTFPLNTSGGGAGGLDWTAGTTNVFSPGGTPTAVALRQTFINNQQLFSVQLVLTAVLTLSLASLWVLQKRVGSKIA